MSMHVHCKTTQGDFSLQNPVMSAPGSFGNVVEYRDLVDLSRLGAAIPNSLMKKDGVPSPNNKFYPTSCGYLSSFGPNNISLAHFIEQEMPLLPDGPALIVDLKARSMEDMQEVAALAASTPRITCIEVNLNCPYAAPGPAYWTDEKQLYTLMRMVRDASGGKPVIAKAPGGEFDMRTMARVLQDAGTDLFVAFNCVSGCAIDIRTHVRQGGGYFGAGIKPYALARLLDAASAFSIPVIGAGGITQAEDVIEYILAGAFAVQVGSANLTRPDLMTRIIDDLEPLMAELHIESLDEIRGTAHLAHAGLF